MNKWIQRALGAVEILGIIATAHKPTRDQAIAYNESVEADYDSAYYSGTMSYTESENWKEYWKEPVR